MAAASASPMKTLEQNLQKASGGTMRAILAHAKVAKAWAKEKIALCRCRAGKLAGDAQVQAMAMAGDRTVQVTAASAAGGTAAVGVGGAAAGALAGGALGGAIGLLPALFTFGLSIPIGAAIGGGCGVAVGGVVGSVAGGVGAGAVGHSAYKRRDEIMAAWAKAKSKTVEVHGTSKAWVACKATGLRQRAAQAHETAQARVHNAFGATRARVTGAATSTRAKAVEIASDKAVQVTAASAAGGAAVVGTGAAATGMVAGGAIGAAVGVVPAVFTFGLSIPVCAAFGGGVGLFGGATVGGAAGAVGGGAAGFGMYTKREAIGQSVQQGLAQMDGAASHMKKAATHSVDVVRARLVGGTGGTID